MTTSHRRQRGEEMPLTRTLTEARGSLVQFEVHRLNQRDHSPSYLYHCIYHRILNPYQQPSHSSSWRLTSKRTSLPPISFSRRLGPPTPSSPASPFPPAVPCPLARFGVPRCPPRPHLLPRRRQSTNQTSSGHPRHRHRHRHRQRHGLVLIHLPPRRHPRYHPCRHRRVSSRR